MLDHKKLRAALLIGMGKPNEEDDADEKETPEEDTGEAHLRDCLEKMFDALQDGDKDAFVEAGVECLMDKGEEEEE